MDDDIVNFRLAVSNSNPVCNTKQATTDSLKQQLKRTKMKSPFGSLSPPTKAKSASAAPDASSQEPASVSGRMEAVKVVGRPENIGDPCPDHPDVKCNLWCLEDNMLVCYRCFIFGPNHKGHRLEEEKAG